MRKNYLNKDIPVVDVNVKRSIEDEGIIIKNALLDSGAFTSVISKKLCDDLNLEYMESQEVSVVHPNIECVTYTADLYLAYIELCDIAIKTRVLGLDFPEKKVTNAIIGRDVLRHFDVILRGKEKKLELIPAL
ncbi:MAG: hypothetical protein ACE5KE_08765 [Methanosarcinales archaeon]